VREAEKGAFTHEHVGKLLANSKGDWRRAILFTCYTGGASLRRCQDTMGNDPILRGNRFGTCQGLNRCWRKRRQCKSGGASLVGRAGWNRTRDIGFAFVVGGEPLPPRQFRHCDAATDPPTLIPKTPALSVATTEPADLSDKSESKRLGYRFYEGKSFIILQPLLSLFSVKRYISHIKSLGMRVALQRPWVWHHFAIQLLLWFAPSW
jgi:hypothetical protein